MSQKINLAHQVAYHGPSRPWVRDYGAARDLFDSEHAHDAGLSRCTISQWIRYLCCAIMRPPLVGLEFAIFDN